MDEDRERKELERKRNNDNNANNVKNAAEVAIASGNPYAMAAGATIKTADKLTGGKASEAIGKGLSTINNTNPIVGKRMQAASNALSESGASDAIGKVAATKNGMSSSSSKDTSSANQAKTESTNTSSDNNNRALSKNKNHQDEPSQINSLERKGSKNKRVSDSLTDENTEENQQKVEHNPANLLYKDEDEEKKAVVVAATAAKLIVLLPLIAAVFLIIFIAAIFATVIAIDEDKDFNEQLSTSGYYANRCRQVTVLTDNGSRTYDFEDYIAGVVSAEVGLFNNLEVYKEFAIAARSYFLTHDDNCTIESSTRRQVFRDITDRSYAYSDLIYQAVDETKGKVIMYNGQVDSVSYDAFCSIEVDANYYTIKQAHHRIPRAWVDAQSGIADSWKQGTCAGNHGNGLSQWGSYYLATEENYTYDEIIRFYLGPEAVISRGAFNSSISGINIQDTTNGNELHQSLAEFLEANGSSIDEFNDTLHDAVVQNGAGTREGVVTAAVNLIDLLYDNYGVRIPYYWGGQYQKVGANPNFGKQTTPSTSSGGTTYYYTGLDCSGFVSWAIRNGGYEFSRRTTKSFDSDFGKDSCDIEDSYCIGQPGDLINSASCHVQMIVGVDEPNGIYYVAESTGAYGVIMRAVDMHQGNCGNAYTKIIYMDTFYDDPANVDSGY